MSKKLFSDKNGTPLAQGDPVLVLSTKWFKAAPGRLAGLTVTEERDRALVLVSDRSEQVLLSEGGKAYRLDEVERYADPPFDMDGNLVALFDTVLVSDEEDDVRGTPVEDYQGEELEVIETDLQHLRLAAPNGDEIIVRNKDVSKFLTVRRPRNPAFRKGTGLPALPAGIDEVGAVSTSGAEVAIPRIEVTCPTCGKSLDSEKDTVNGTITCWWCGWRK